MKKIFSILAILTVTSSAFSQNVGINNSNPLFSLDINGGFRLRSENATVTGTSVMLTSNRSHHVLIGSPTGDFNIAFIGATELGQHAIITNTTLYKGFLLPIYIQPNTTVELIYSNGAWKMIGSSEEVRNIAWSTTGNENINPSINFIGTTTDADVVIKRGGVLSGLLGSALNSTSWGISALNKDNTGSSNTAIGVDALKRNASGYDNTALGTSSLTSNIGGWRNTAIGRAALVNNTEGNNNTALGHASLFYNITGNQNTAGGAFSLNINVNGNYNTAFGYAALIANTSGNNNTAIGLQALRSNTGGYSNAAIGIGALYFNTTKSNLVAIGDSALFFNGNGATAGLPATANTAIGSKALYSNTTGYTNTAVGFNAMYGNQSGGDNTAIGNNSLRALAGNGNTAIGSFSLFQNQNSNNTAIGLDALRNNTTGSGNVAIGFTAGRSELTSNKLYIENSNADKDNALIYGDFSSDSLNLNAKVNIRDFTRLGAAASGAPAIKMKELQLTSAAASTGQAAVNHGLDPSKIISVTTLLQWDNGYFAPTEYSPDPLLRYNYFVSPTQIVIQNNAASCAYICSKPVKILITYKE